MAAKKNTGSFTKEFQDLITAIGECKAKTEEARIMEGERLRLKRQLAELSQEQSQQAKRESMIRLIYLDMLGYDASFGAIQAVTMAANINPVLKRVGYLAASILLGPEHELALMLTNTIQRDLKSENFVVVCAALDACCKLMSRDTVPALLPVIEPLSESGFEPVRKKTALALERVLQLTPDRAEDLFPRLRKALLDREPGVMTTALNAIYTAAKADPSPLRDLASPIQHILGQVVQGRLPKAYEYHKLPAPFLQIKIVRTLAVLAHGDRQTSSMVASALLDVLRRARHGSNTIAHAVAYECVRAAASLTPPGAMLLGECAQVVSSLLRPSASPNLKYAGIQALASLVALDVRHAEAHQGAVIDCLEDPDPTLRKTTLELLAAMTHEENVEVIADRMLAFLRDPAVSPEMRVTLGTQLAHICTAYGPTLPWRLRTMASVAEVCGKETPHEVSEALAECAAECRGGEACRMALDVLLPYLKRFDTPESLLEVAVWAAGEFASQTGLPGVDTERSEDAEDALCGLAASKELSGPLHAALVLALGKLGGRGGGRGLSGEAMDALRKACTARDPALQQQALEVQAVLSADPGTRSAAVAVSDATMEIDADLAFLDAFCDAAAASGKGGRYVPRNERDPLSGETSVAFNNVLAPGRAPDTHVRNADAPLKIAAYEGPPKPASVDSGWGVVQAGSGDVVPESRAASALPADSSRGAVPPPAAGPHGPVLLAAQRSAAVVGARRWGERSSAPSDAPPPSATSIASGTRTAPDRGGADAGGRSQEARAAYGAGDTDGMDAAKRALAESLFGRGSSKERASGGSGAEGRSAGQAAVGGARRAPEPAVDLLSLDAPSQSVPSHPPTSSNAPSDLLSDLDGLPPRAHLQPPSHVPPQPSPSSAPPASAVSSHTPTHPPLASSSGPSPRGDSLGDLLGGPALEDPFAVAAPLGQGGSVPGEAPMVARKAAGVVGRGGAPMKGGVGAGNGNGVRGSQKKDPFADLLG